MGEWWSYGLCANRTVYTDGNVLYLLCPVWQPLATCGFEQPTAGATESLACQFYVSVINLAFSLRTWQARVGECQYPLTGEFHSVWISVFLLRFKGKKKKSPSKTVLITLVSQIKIDVNLNYLNNLRSYTNECSLLAKYLSVLSF